MAEDAAPRALVGEGSALAALRTLLPALPSLDQPGKAVALHAAAPDPCYVLFTSGSGGRPKGVAMGEGPIARLIAWQAAHARLGEAAVTLLFAPFSFDVHVQEIFGAMATAGTLVLVDDATRRDPGRLAAAIASEGVERLYLPYVALQMLADAAGDATLPLRDVVSAGEQLVLTPAIRALFARHPAARLHNHYGPTETHVVTAHTLPDDVDAWPTVAPIGVALPHVAILPGAAGEDGGRELLLGGDCLAHGYLGRPDLDEGRFITMPNGRRAYATGDLDEAMRDRLMAMARRHGTTPFVLLLAAWVALLQRLTGQDDLVVGTPVRGREAAELMPVMGFFVNALPMRFKATDKTLKAWIASMQSVASEAFGDPDVPIETLVRALQVPRDPSRPVLFQTMFSFQNARARPRQWGALSHERFAVPITGASHEWSLWCVETTRGIELAFTFAADLVSPALANRWADAYDTAVHRLVELAGDAPLAALWDTEQETPAGEDHAALLRRIWRELLDTEEIADDDNFFDLGGHSLLALTMVSRVELACGKRLSLLRVGDSSLGALAQMLRDEADAVPGEEGSKAGAGNGKRLGSWLRRLVGQPDA